MSTEIHKKTTYYRRWNIARTQKEGWAPKDATVSATYEDGKEPSHERMTQEARHAIEEAQAACDALNAQDAENARFTKKDS